jgi:hypothetical protein
MPIDLHLEHESRLIRSHAHQRFTEGELSEFISGLLALPEVVRHNILIELNEVTEFGPTSSGRLIEFAAIAASADEAVHSTKLAVIAEESLHYGLARVYQT